MNDLSLWPSVTLNAQQDWTEQVPGQDGSPEGSPSPQGSSPWASLNLGHIIGALLTESWGCSLPSSGSRMGKGFRHQTFPTT